MDKAPRTALVGLLLVFNPHAPPLLGLRCPCQEGAIRWDVNQPAQLALARKSCEPEAQTCALLGKPQKQRLTNDILRVLLFPGAWALGAAQSRGVRGALPRQWPAHKTAPHVASSHMLAQPDPMRFLEIGIISTCTCTSTSTSTNPNPNNPSQTQYPAHHYHSRWRTTDAFSPAHHGGWWAPGLALGWAAIKGHAPGKSKTRSMSLAWASLCMPEDAQLKPFPGIQHPRAQARHNACLSFWLADFASQGELRLPYDMQGGLLKKGRAKQHNKAPPWG